MLPKEILAGPLATLGFGGLLGAAVGFTAKKVSKLLALVVGLLFIALQLLAWNGWVTVDWSSIEAAARSHWASSDGTTVLDRAWEVIASNLPFGGGFAAGFLLGFRMG